MRDCWRIEILRLGTAALIRIFTRTLTCLGQWRCRNGRCLRSRLARSSQAYPTGFLANFSPCQHVVALFQELASLSSWCTLLYPSRRDVHRIRWSCQASCKQYTSHVTFFSCLCALVMMCHTTLAQVIVHVISSMCHAPECLISLRPSLRTLRLSLPSSTSSSRTLTSTFSSSVWMLPEQDPLCTSPNEESGLLANNAPLTHLPQTNLASTRPCLIPSRIFPLGNTDTLNSAASANFITSPWYGFPKQSSNAVFLLPFTWYPSSNRQAYLTNHGHTSMVGVPSIERRVPNSRRKLRI